ncbi:MAG: dephospho-CoA kinase [Bacteroidia bacterium]|nr:dephospho-CoA kinase [Bacteroidia bacterium]
MILKVGITGGIGSGKSTVAKIFEVLGIPVFYADDAAKELMNKDETLKQELIKEFGNELYSNGALNRSYLSSLVFSDPKKLTLLNAIVHPVTIANAEKWMQQQTTHYAIKEAALIFESDAHKQLDKVIGVFAPTPLRLQRVRQRDNISEDAIVARMNKQMEEETKMKLCDYVITNNDLELIIPQVLKIHEALLDFII